MTKPKNKNDAGIEVSRENLHLYVFVWQSSLQGGGPVADYAFAPNPRILQLTGKNTLEIAAEPLFERPGKDHYISQAIQKIIESVVQAPP